MRKFLLVLAFVAACVVAGPCDSNSESTCRSTIVSSTARCVWAEQRCQADPCGVYLDNSTCSADKGCISIAGVGLASANCIHRSLVCTKLPTGSACDQSGMCRTSGQYCVWGLPDGGGAAGDSFFKCLSFPLWSIGLIVVWIIIMIVIVFIIMILKKGKHTEAVKGIEQDGEVHVDTIAGGNMDTFAPAATTSNLQQPLATNQL